MPLHFAPKHANETEVSSGMSVFELARLPYLKRRQWLRSRQSRTSYPPRFIYKYISPDIKDEWLEDYMIHSRFWLSSSMDFNDPFDMSAQVINEGSPQQRRRRCKEIFQISPEAQGLSKEQIEAEVTRIMLSKFSSVEHIKSHILGRLSRVGISCLSENPRSLLMWSHYAKHHKGVVLQFDVAHDPEVLSTALQVTYTEEFPVLNFAAKDQNEQFSKYIRQKFNDWSYEKEWRILRIDAAKQYLPFRSQALAGIIFGVRAAIDIKAKIVNLIEKRKALNMKSIKIFKAQMHKSRYQIIVMREPKEVLDSKSAITSI
jgi:hypothetical protein